MPVNPVLGRTLPGAKWRNTHQVTVNAVLGADPNSPNYRRVRSLGTQFYNQDTWYARTFGAALCEWARLNKEVQPTRWDVEGWLRNSLWRAKSAERLLGITIAETPDDLSVELAMALVGGAYHEAWHTEYSRRTPIDNMEVWPKIQELWGKIPWAPERGYRGWSKLTVKLLEWSNIIEDIRIERIGTREYPGSPEKMEALQDLILRMESEGRSKRPPPLEGDEFLSTVMGAFRDLGLGYETSTQNQALEKYQTRSPEAWALVTRGKLRPLLDRAIHLKKEDTLESLWLAMEVMIVLADIAAPEAARKWAEKNKPATPPMEQEEGAGTTPAPSAEPQVVDQADATPDEGEDSGGSPTPVITNKPPIYKVGDVIRIKTGPYENRKAEIVRASLPDPVSGVQEVDFALVDED
jgi:hypothetical protein